MTRQFVCTPEEPVVQTSAGRVHGFLVDGLACFRGIPYAKARRFQMPEPPDPWTGVLDATSYGYVCPMLERESAQGELLVAHRYWPKDENCQSLNLWSPGLDGKKRPVLVWLHGGGFSSGSSIEHMAYDGEALSRFGDAVVVSLNHRLNILGYLDLSAYGEQYWNSANVGNADIVAATKASSIHHFIESLSHGYNTQISEDSDNISAGEKQLLTIARAMVANPPMMILDEATSNVDTRTEQLIQDAFTKLTAGRTSFVIAHRLSTIRNSDLILVMRDGNIVEQGTHDQLLQQNGFYAELYNSQFADN